MEDQLNLGALFSKASDYVETNIDLIKLKAVDKASSAISWVVSKIMLAIIAIMFIVIVSIGAALWLGELTGKSFYGFFIVAGFYLIAGFVVYACRRTILKAPVANSLIKKMSK